MLLPSADAGMTTYWDAMLGNITDLVKARGMWDNTLMVLTADNVTSDALLLCARLCAVSLTSNALVPGRADVLGSEARDLGPLDAGLLPQQGRRLGRARRRRVQLALPREQGTNRLHLPPSPLLRLTAAVALAQVSNWEGGTRGASFVSGGFLPVNVRGTQCHEKVHVADWCKLLTLPAFCALSVSLTWGASAISDATFAHLAGVDPEDPNTVGTRTDGTKFALPGVDSLNVSAAPLRRPARLSIRCGPSVWFRSSGPRG